MADLLARFDETVRRAEPRLPSGYRTERGSGDVLRAFGPFPDVWNNWIGYHRFNAADAEAVVDEQVMAFGALGHAFRWKVYDHDQPTELPVLLTARGFVRTDTTALMVMESAEAAQLETSSVAYVQLEDPETLAEELRPVADAVWDDDADQLIETFGMELRDMPEHMALFAAKLGGQTVGSGLIRYNDEFTFGGLYAGNTVPEARGRGVYRGMIAARAQHALARNAGHLFVEAGDMSRPILERVGFEEIAQVSNYAFGV